MSAARKFLSLQCWIPPDFAWESPTGLFWLELPITDPDVVALIAKGFHDFEAFPDKERALAFAAIIGPETLTCQLVVLMTTVGQPKPAGWQIEMVATVRAHCHGLFLLPGENFLGVLVGAQAPPDLEGWITSKLRTEAQLLHNKHQTKLEDFNKETARQKQMHKDSMSKLTDPILSGLMAIQEASQGPVTTAEPLLPFIPRAAKFLLPRSTSPGAVVRAAIGAIGLSNWPPSRDGTYMGILGLPLGSKRQGVVSWTPHQGLPSYPEVRWCVQRRLPAALCKPRATQPERPEFKSGLRSIDGSVVVYGFDPDSPDLIDALEDIALDASDFRKRVHEAKQENEERGFEALAWFQPYHTWSEDTWGIYIDALKLDNFALTFLDCFSSLGVRGSHSLAALLAFELIYAHELFHAKVEAALSWSEVNAGQPRHLRYKQRVYDALRETPEWLEEALANWSSWQWFKSDPAQESIARWVKPPQNLDHIIELSLDLSPPGYRDWRIGNNRATWRIFATQLNSASRRLPMPSIGLPIDSMLSGPLPYDFRSSDIPLRFVGRGVIADRLQIFPATFNVPTRNELEKALRFFKHIVDPSGGKGSHQKWTGPDQRAFALPTRDPVSRDVFNKFLHYLGIDKAAYVREVRPNL